MEPVVIADYNPQWPVLFEEIAGRVRSAFAGGPLLAVEHVGSTSVPGLAAKPVIDLDVVIASEADLGEAITRLATLGYAYEGDKGIPGRSAFLWPPGTQRHHLYVCASGSAELHRHLAFRNYLLANPDAVRRYETLKRELAQRYRGDRAAYNDGKTEFVEAVLAAVMDEISLVDYDPRWPEQFAAEAERILSAVGADPIVSIEHFGSTAIPGMPAKPVIDLLVAVRSLTEARQCAVPALEAMGYSYWRDDPAPDRLFLVKGLPPDGPRTHHVHIVEPDVSHDPRLGEFSFTDRLLFRDYLKAHPEEAQRYAALKQDLAVRFPDDREAYTEGKTEYVYSIMQKARTREE